MQLSYWEKNTFFTDIDVTIIGSGIVGLHAAIYLKQMQPQLKVMIVDRGFLPYGASTRNAGFACFGSVSELLDDLSREDENTVFARVEKRWKGLLGLRLLLGDDAIQFESKGGYEIFTDDDSELFKSCADKLSYLNQKINSITSEENTFAIDNEKINASGFAGVKNIINNRSEGQIDTGKMMLALLQVAQQHKVILLNGVGTKQITSNSAGVEIETDKEFSFTSKKVVVCNNGFAKQLLPNIEVKPGRAQVLITSPIENLKVRGTFHYQQGYYYFRDVGNRILLGGGRNLNFEGETTTEFALTEQIQQQLEKILTEVILPNQSFTIDQRWSGIMGLGDSKSTIIKKVQTNVYCAVRLGGMGIAIGNLVGKEAAEMVFGD